AGLQLHVDADAVERAQVQPLRGVAGEEIARARIVEQARGLRFQVRAQLAPVREREQLVVGHRVPQEIRQAAGQRVIVERLAAGHDSVIGPSNSSDLMTRAGEVAWALSTSTSFHTPSTIRLDRNSRSSRSTTGTGRFSRRPWNSMTCGLPGGASTRRG